jgi:hypothetical protein
MANEFNVFFNADGVAGVMSMSGITVFILGRGEA